MNESKFKSVLRSYISKHGHGRGLDKFLRRNSFSSYSSSEEKDNSIRTNCKSHSCENLNEPVAAPPTPPPEEQEKAKESVMKTAKIVVKQSSEKTKKSPKFNCESIIELNIPLFNMYNEQGGGGIAQQQENKIEEPIKPVIQANPAAELKIPIITNNNQTIGSLSDGSPVSNKQAQLDWDGFILGFDTSVQRNFQLCNPMDLEKEELEALKSYFNEKGLQLPNENLVVVIKKSNDLIPERLQRLNVIKENKEKWQNIYEKYKEKYCQPGLAQSTPKEVPLKKTIYEKYSQTSLNWDRSSSKNSKPEQPARQQVVDGAESVCSSQASNDYAEVYQNSSEAVKSFEFVKPKPKSSSAVSSADESSEKKDVSIRSEDTTNFDDSLKVAIALLSSLLESKHLKADVKRNLASKIILKIAQIQTSKSIQTSTLDSSDGRRSCGTVSSVKTLQEEILQKCFEPITQSEAKMNDYQNLKTNSNKQTKATKSSSNNKRKLLDYVKQEKESHMEWIEKEIDHLKNLRELLKRNVSESNTLATSKEATYENLLPVDSAKNTPEPSQSSSARSKGTAQSEDNANFWNSHLNLKKAMKSRSKLNTPESSGCSHEESLASFITNRNKKFLEKYEKHNRNQQEANVYTKPYSGSSTNKPTQQQASKNIQTSTSLASSSVFESSDSMSLPKTSQNTKSSNAVKHTNQKVMGTQTTDSICRTKSIFGTQKDFGTTSTQRVMQTMNHKQAQTHRPPSVKYTLTFEKKKTSKQPFASLPISTSVYATSQNSQYSKIQRFHSADICESEDKENMSDALVVDANGCSLQTYFNKQRPVVFSKFEERKKCIEELKKLRALRNEHRNKLLLLTSDKSLEGKLLLNNLPALPLKTKRMFSTKDLKLQTVRTIRNLTEVQQKKDIEKQQNLKRKNRIMTEIFNKNLQKNVLKGKLNLSNTVNLMTK